MKQVQWKIFEPLFCILQPWDFWGNAFVNCYYICSVSQSCRKLAGIPCCKFRFTNDQQQWLGKFAMSPLLCCIHITAKLLSSYQPTHIKILILNKPLGWFFVVWFGLVFCFGVLFFLHEHKQQLSSEDKNVLLFSRIIGCNWIYWNYILWHNSKHPLIQVLQPFFGPVWVQYLRFYTIKAQSDHQKFHIFPFKLFTIFVNQ